MCRDPSVQTLEARSRLFVGIDAPRARSGRHTECNMSRWHRVGHDGPGADDRAVPNRNALQDCCSFSDPHCAADLDRRACQRELLDGCPGRVQWHTVVVINYCHTRRDEDPSSNSNVVRRSDVNATLNATARLDRDPARRGDPIGAYAFKTRPRSDVHIAPHSDSLRAGKQLWPLEVDTTSARAELASAQPAWEPRNTVPHAGCERFFVL